jgi:hypothetical protein
MVVLPLIVSAALGFACPSYDGTMTQFETPHLGYTYQGTATNVSHTGGVWSFDLDGSPVSFPDSAFRWGGFNDYNCTFVIAYYLPPIFSSAFE